MSPWDCWIFDLDGTLVRAVHDFEAIRRELALPAGTPILEALDALPPDEARPRHERLDEIERELAQDAVATPGARELLGALQERGAELGIVTRNSFRTAQETLAAAGLGDFFRSADVLGREHAPPKPLPDGIQTLLARWSAEPERAVMVGDYRFDLLAGRAAGVATVYVDASARYPFASLAEHCVRDLGELAERWQLR